MKRNLIAVALGSALLLPLAACDLSAPSGDSGIEFEDCDAEDLRSREAECGFSGKKTSGPKPPVVKPPVVKPPVVRAPVGPPRRK